MLKSRSVVVVFAALYAGRVVMSVHTLCTLTGMRSSVIASSGNTMCGTAGKQNRIGRCMRM